MVVLGGEKSPEEKNQPGDKTLELAKKKVDYYWVSDLSEVNGKLAYEATKDSKSFFVYGNTKIGYNFTLESDLVGLNGEVAFVAGHGSWGSREFVVSGDERGDKYGEITGGLTVVNGKLAYIAGKGWGFDRFVVYGGEEVGKKYEDVYELAEVNGKLTYVAKKGSDRIIVFGGEEVGEEYCCHSDPTEVNGKLAYIAGKTYSAGKKGKYLVVHGGKESKKYPFIHRLTEISGRPTFIVKEGDQEFIVHGEKESKKYDRVYPPTEIDGELVIGQRKITRLLLYLMEKK